MECGRWDYNLIRVRGNKENARESTRIVEAERLQKVKGERDRREPGDRGERIRAIWLRPGLRTQGKRLKPCTTNDIGPRNSLLPALIAPAKLAPGKVCSSP